MKIRFLTMALFWGVLFSLFSGSGLASTEQRIVQTSPITTISGEPARSSSFSWQLREIDNSVANIGEYPSLTLDSKGYPHIAYMDTTYGRLTYYYEDAHAGYYLRFSTADGEGKYPKLVLDEFGRAHISYLDGQFLYYTHQNNTGGFESSEMVTGGVKDAFGGLALVNGEMPYFSYDSQYGLRISYKGSYYPPYYSHKTVGGQSSFEQYSSMALDQNGYPHITYYEGDNANLMYVYRDGAGWHTPIVVDSTGYVGMRPSLALDQDGRAHISYWDWGNGYLKYAYRDQFGQWHTEIVDNSGTAGEYSSLAVDINGRPHIAYYESSGGDLWYAYKPDYGIWQLEMVDSTGNVGIDPSLALYLHVTPHIAYYDSSNGRLKYAQAQADYSGWFGNIECAWGSGDCNACVNDVVGSFNSLRSQGDILGYHLGDHPDTGYTGNLEFHKHWQGVQRVAAGDGRTMIVTHDDAVNWVGVGWSTFAVVQMSSRNSEGERFRSDRLAWNLPFEETPPPRDDSAVATGWIFDEREHPGGIQVMGNILAVGTDNIVTFWDLMDPYHPQRIPNLAVNRLDGKTGSTTSLVQLIDGTFLLAVSSSDAESIDFYPSVSTELTDGFSSPFEWRPGDLEEAGQFYYGWDTFQSLNFVTECGTGKLFLVGTSNLDKTATCWWPNLFGKPCFPDGQNWASLYEVTQDSSQVKLTKVAERRFECDYRGEKQCNFDAAAGVYVDPHHQLFLYSTEHTSDGPNNTVKFMEFRPRPHASCSTVDDAWVELFNGRFPGYGWSLMIDWLDRDLENYGDYDLVEGFDEKASSVEWCLPEDWTIQLYAAHYTDGEVDDPCGGKMLTLTGNGAVQTSILSDSAFENMVYCSRTVFDPPRSEYYDPNLGVTIVYYPPAASSFTPAVNASSGASNESNSAPNQSITIGVPPQAVIEPISITLKAISPPSFKTTPLGSTSYGFSLSTQGGTLPPEDFAFALPAAITIQYADKDMIGLYEDTLDLYFWDDPTEQWVPAATTCNPQTVSTLNINNDTLQTEICNVGEYALLGELSPTAVLIDEAHDNQLSLDEARAREIEANTPWNDDWTWFFLSQLETDLLDARRSATFQLANDPNNPLTYEQLKNYDALVIPPYHETMTVDEVEAIKKFVASGGGLLMLGDCGFDPPNPELPEAYGIQFDPRCVFAPYDSEVGLDGDLEIVNFDLSHPAAAGISQFNQNWGQSFINSYPAYQLSDTWHETWEAWKDENSNDVYDPGEEGVFTIASITDTGCGRVAAVADNSFSDGAVGGWPHNNDIIHALLNWVTAGTDCPLEEKMVLVDELHDNRLTLNRNRAQQIVNTQGWGDLEGYWINKLSTNLINEFTFEQIATGELNDTLLANYDALVISWYFDPLTAGEVNAVKNFVAAGGGLILIGDCAFDNPNPELAASYDLVFRPECLFAPVPQYEGAITSFNYSGSPPILDDHTAYTQNWGQWLQPNYDNGAVFWLLDTGGINAWIDSNWNEQYESGEEAYVDVVAGYDTGCGRVIAIADDTFGDMHMDWTDNDEFLRDVLRWVTDNTSCEGGNHIFLPLAISS